MCNTTANSRHSWGERRRGDAPHSYGVGDAGLVRNCRNEIVELYRAYIGEIFAYCVRRLASKQLAEDATSAVFLRLVEQYPVLKHKGRKRIRSWLYGTASNVIARFLRDASRCRDIAAELGRRRRSRFADDPEEHGHLDWPILYEAIGRLKRRHQEILVLRYFQGLETSAIAAALGMKHVTVRVQLSRAVKRLRRELEAAFGERPEQAR